MALMPEHDIDSVFGKRVLTYWENRGTPDYNQMNEFDSPRQIQATIVLFFMGTNFIVFLTPSKCNI